MTLPRRCPLCRGKYDPDGGYMQLHAEPGGAPAPEAAGSSGRLLILLCRLCRGEYFWDEPGGRKAAPFSRAELEELYASGAVDADREELYA
jgi:hypothetical protein